MRVLETSTWERVMNKHTILNHPYVYIVLEHYTKGKDAFLHGVYTTRDSALGKVSQLVKKNEKLGYLCVLKKPIQGRRPRF